MTSQNISNGPNTFLFGLEVINTVRFGYFGIQDKSRKQPKKIKICKNYYSKSRYHGNILSHKRRLITLSSLFTSLPKTARRALSFTPIMIFEVGLPSPSLNI